MKGKWALNAADVEIYEISGAGGEKGNPPDKPARFLQLRLLHAPTGVDVQKSSEWMAMTRTEAAKRRQAMVDSLWPELEKRVAKHLRIPGR